MSSVEDVWLDEQYEEFWADEDERWREEQLRDEFLVLHERDIVEFRNGWFDYTDEECV